MKYFFVFIYFILISIFLFKSIQIFEINSYSELINIRKPICHKAVSLLLNSNFNSSVQDYFN